MTRDSSRIGALKLYNPIYVTVSDRGTQNDLAGDSGVLESDRQFTLPDTLTVCPANKRSLFLLHI